VTAQSSRRLRRTRTHRAVHGPAGRGRLLLGCAAAASTAPYLFLKVMWVTGSTIGMSDPAAFHDSAYQAANLLSILLDAVAAGVAIALTVPRGRRLSAPLVLLPAWVATGLLGTVLVLTAVAAPLAVATSPGDGADALRGWVYVVVYGGFSAQGILLLTAFVLYARDRWLGALQQSESIVTGAPPIRAATTLAALSAVVGLLLLGWALGIRAGLGTFADRLSGVDRATLVVQSLFVLAAAVGTLLTVRPHRARWWLPPALVWCGTASMVTWGCYALALDAWHSWMTSPALAFATGAKVVFGVADAVLIGTIVRRKLLSGGQILSDATTSG